MKLDNIGNFNILIYNVRRVDMIRELTQNEQFIFDMLMEAKRESHKFNVPYLYEYRCAYTGRKRKLCSNTNIP